GAAGGGRLDASGDDRRGHQGLWAGGGRGGARSGPHRPGRKPGAGGARETRRAGRTRRELAPDRAPPAQQGEARPRAVRAGAFARLARPRGRAGQARRGLGRGGAGARAVAGERGRRRTEERLPASRGAGAGAAGGGSAAPRARGAHDDRAVHRGRGAAAAHVPRPPVAARRTEGGWAMAGDALDGDVRRLRYSGRGGGTGDPPGYRPVRAEGDGSGSRGTGGGAGDGGGERAGRVTESAFHLTPLDVRKQEFRKSLRGYEPMGVEDFRVRVADELERILREKSVLEERVAARGEQLRAYRERERAMNAALGAAQHMRGATDG